MTREEIVGEVATVVGLAEGDAGVADVIRAVARLEPVAVRKVSRATELPVPFVSAICNELRKRGVVSAERPVQLTPHGRTLFGSSTRTRLFEAACPTCAGRELVIAPALARAVSGMAALAARAPRPRVDLDQVHCTVETKIRRVLALHEAGALEGKHVVLLGDDDLTSVAVKLVGAQVELGLRRLSVLDVDPAVVSFGRDHLRGAPFAVDCLVHDLRDPLPERLRGSAETVLTDPPYTGEGARLFLSRAAAAIGAHAGRDVFLAFGASRPATTLAMQRSIVEAGLTIRRLIRGFNEYQGAGILGGASHLYHLVTTTEVRPLVPGRYDGPLYTGDVRAPIRAYRCKGCGVELRVGRGRRWSTVEALKRDRCPRCDGDRFLPLGRGRRGR
jgi:predicted methyltransferase